MNNWTTEELKTLHQIVSKADNKPTTEDFKKAAKQLGKSVSSCSRRFARTDWVAFKAGEFGQLDDIERRPWTKSEKLHLFALKNNLGYDYGQIAGILKRSKTSCERMFQRTDWKVLAGNPNKIKSEIEQARQEEETHSNIIKMEMSEKETQRTNSFNARIVDWLVHTVKSEPDILTVMDEAAFNSKLEKMIDNPDSKVNREDITIDFDEIKRLAMEEIDRRGMTYPKTREFGTGRYLVFGDSHGKNLPTGMAKLLDVMNRELKCTATIHIGGIADDEDEISYNWHKIEERKSFPNLVVLGDLTELHLLKRQIHKYDVVRQRIMLGGISVENQYDMGDFCKKSVGRIDPLTIPDVVIVNSHRHEMHSHCGYKRERLVMSPGCLCRRHPVRTTRINIFKGGEHLRQTYQNGYKKYNKQDQDSARWENGLIIVEVGTDGKSTAHPLRICDSKCGKTTSYAGKIYTEQGVFSADQRIFINGDMHCTSHDPKVLDIQEQFCQDYKPDIHVNVGDLIDNRAFNHHMGGTTGPAFYKDSGRYVYRDSMFEIASSRYVLKRMRNWARKSYLIIGNHERFADDLTNRMPQLQDLLKTEFMLGTEDLDIEVTPLGGTLDFGFARFIHGDVKVWGGVGGSKMDKIANNYGRNTIMGNIHYPAIRSGCYSIPMSGLLNQKYNETDASQWMQGFGYADVFDGKCFISIVVMTGGQCMVDGKQYLPSDCYSWETPQYKIRLDVEFDSCDTQRVAVCPVPSSRKKQCASRSKG